VIFRDAGLDGVIVIEPDRIEDERGHFARTWCHEAFEAHGLAIDFVQCNTSFNHRRGTLRGLHYQVPPHEEGKLIRCTRGRIFDVIVDVRKDSPTFGAWQDFELSAKNRNSLYIPEGFAHGFLTLSDNTEVFYQMSEFYSPENGRGFHWNDPSLAIDWPYPPQVLSKRDESLPLLTNFHTLPVA